MTRKTNIVHLSFDLNHYNFNSALNKKNKTIGLFFLGQHYKISDFIFPPLYFIKYLKSSKRRKYLMELYNIKKNDFVYFEPNIKTFISNFKRSHEIFTNINSLDDVLKINEEGIYIGDLIYDTYIRMFNIPSLKKDLNLFLLINRSVSEIQFLKQLNLTPEIYTTKFTSYTASGLPFRFFLKNNSKMISFYSNPNGKIHTFDDFSQMKNFKFFHKTFSKLEDKRNRIKKGLKYAREINHGKKKYSYMKYSPYDNSDKILNIDLDGVIFLHDFFDSQYIYGDMLFNDFYTWTIKTIEFVKINNLKVGFKPHPNQIIESKKIVKKLKRLHKDIIWIDEKIPNNLIFNSGIKYGVSVYGSILAELAFNNIIPIGCGTSPSDNYNFVIKPKTKNQYLELLLNFDTLKLKFDRNEIGEYFYMNYIHD